MRSRHLITLDAPTRARDVAPFLAHLAAALDGTGPAVLPLPSGPQPLRDSLIDAADLGQTLERDDVALVVATSGSTGRPKLAMLTAAAVRASAERTLEAIGGPCVWTVALPTSSVGGLQMLVRSLVAGTEPELVDLTRPFTPAGFLASVTSGRATDGVGRRATSLVPTQLYRLLDDDDARSALVAFDAVLVGGAAAAPDLVARARDQGVRAITTYGMTETSGGCVYDGIPLPGAAVRIDARGHIVISGPTVFCGYRGDPQLTAEVLRASELHTQDLGELDDGRLTVLGRGDDVVVSGGVNVSCQQVEAVLLDHPQVDQAIVVGVDDVEWGQRVVAVVVPGAGHPPPTTGQLRSFAAGRLPSAGLPRTVIAVDQLPVLTSGKPDRMAVRTLASGPSPDRPH